MLAKDHDLGLLGNCQSETPTMWHCGVGSEHDDDSMMMRRRMMRRRRMRMRMMMMMMMMIIIIIIIIMFFFISLGLVEFLYGMHNSHQAKSYSYSPTFWLLPFFKASFVRGRVVSSHHFQKLGDGGRSQHVLPQPPPGEPQFATKHRASTAAGWPLRGSIRQA